MLLIVEIASIIAVFFTRTIYKKLFSILYGEKGENLATKEDDKEFTRKAERKFSKYFIRR